VVCFPRVGSGVVSRFWEAWWESPIAVFRAGIEGFLMAEGGRRGRTVLRGVARLGADFWDCLTDSRGRMRGSVAGRYPGSAWGQLNLNYGCRYFLAPGKDGSVATVRLEMIKEGLQEAEARIFIEKALLDADSRARLGAELTGRARQLLDRRQRAFRRFIPQEQWGYLPLEPAWYPASGWQEASASLYDLAAALAAKLAP